MFSHRSIWLVGMLAALSTTAKAAPLQRIGYAEAVTRALARAPALDVARGSEAVVAAESRIAGVYPNPTLLAGTSTQTAKFSVGASIPLVVLGQIHAANAAARADVAVAKLDTEVTAADVRAGSAHAFVTLWLAERTALARSDAATVAARLEEAVKGRVELGSSPEMEGLRVHSERMRADMDRDAAGELVNAASAELAAFIGTPPDELLRTEGDPDVPASMPPLGELLAKTEQNPSFLRALAEVRASEARADSERSQVRPLMTINLGADFKDPTLPSTNYRAELGVELPLFNQRGPQIGREVARGKLARSEAQRERVQQSSALAAAYRTFLALSRQAETLANGVVPAAEAAAKATEESYTLGRAPLISVLDAEKARIDVEVSLIETRAARANAWIDLQRAIGVR